MGRPSEIHVLVIEDEDAESSLLQRTIGGQSGMSVHRANALGAGMDLLSTHDFDIVLLATVRSGVDGLNGLVELVECAGTTPVIVLNGCEGDHTVKEAFRRGAHDYIVKNVAMYPAIPRIVTYAVERTRTQKRRAKLLKEQEVVRGTLSAMLSVFSECTVCLDGRKRVLLASIAFSKLVGTNPEQLVDKPFLGLVDEDDRTDVDASIDRARTSGRLATTHAVTLRKADGAEIPIVVRIAPTVMEDGPSHFVLKIEPEDEQGQLAEHGEERPVDLINDVTRHGKGIAASQTEMVGLRKVREDLSPEWPRSRMGAAIERQMGAILSTLESKLAVVHGAEEPSAAAADNLTESNASRENTTPQNEMDADRLSWARAKYRLTDREQDVLSCIAVGMPNSEIARLLGIKIATVKVHVARILLKLGVSNRTKAALIANSKPLAYEGPWRD